MSTHGTGKGHPFPNRPATDDFRLLSQIVRGNDNFVDEEGGDVESSVERFIDLPSLTYILDQRCSIMRSMFPDAPAEAMMKAAWLDAFVAGCEFQKRKSEGQ